MPELLSEQAEWSTEPFAEQAVELAAGPLPRQAFTLAPSCPWRLTAEPF